MAHEKELLQKFAKFWNNNSGKDISITDYRISEFLSTLPEEKEKKCPCKDARCNHKICKIGFPDLCTNPSK